MIKVTELMINDWVCINGSNYLVKEIKKNGVIKLYEDTKYSEHEIEFNADYIEDNIEPIPLTSEILEKNGFKKKVWREYREPDVITYAIGGGFFIEVTADEYWLVDNCSDSNDCYYTSNWITKVEYVHKLQHLMRDLEIEKEIVL